MILTVWVFTVSVNITNAYVSIHFHTFPHAGHGSVSCKRGGLIHLCVCYYGGMPPRRPLGLYAMWVCLCARADSRTAWWAKNEVRGNCSALSPEWQGCHDWGFQHEELDTPAFFSLVRPSHPSSRPSVPLLFSPLALHAPILHSSRGASPSLRFFPLVPKCPLVCLFPFSTPASAIRCCIM